MNVRGLGVDIVNVRNFRKLTYKKNPDFYKNIFTLLEIKYCLSKSDPYQAFAARFAAKEAVLKAVGGDVFDLQKIEIRNSGSGKPEVSVFIKKKKMKVMMSMSHIKEQAIAVAIWLS